MLMNCFWIRLYSASCFIIELKEVAKVPISSPPLEFAIGSMLRFPFFTSFVASIIRDKGCKSLFITYSITPPTSIIAIIKIVCIDTKFWEFVLSSSPNCCVKSSDDAINCEAAVSISVISLKIFSVGAEDSCGSVVSSLEVVDAALVSPCPNNTIYLLSEVLFSLISYHFSKYLDDNGVRNTLSEEDEEEDDDVSIAPSNKSIKGTC